MLALKRAKDPKIIYINLNDELKKDPEVLDFVFPQTNYHAYARHLTNNHSIQRSKRLYPGRDIIWPEEVHSELVNFGKKLSPRSAKKLSPNRSAKNSTRSAENSTRSTKNLGGGIKKSKKRKTKI
jgi:hypothetical protein